MATKSCNNVELYFGVSMTSISIFRKLGDEDGQMFTFPHSLFRLRGVDKNADFAIGYLTLKDVSDQIKKKFGNIPGPIFVWVETPLDGQIYIYGNDASTPFWTKYGETIGFA